MGFLNNKALSEYNIYILKSLIVSNELTIVEEILNSNGILKNKPEIIYNVDDIKQSYNKTNILFFDKNSISIIKEMNSNNKNQNIKLFFVSKEINNKLYNMFYNGFIIEPTLEQRDEVLNYIIEKIVNFEKVKNFELNNRKLVNQQHQLNEIFELLYNSSLVSKIDVNGNIITVNDIFAETLKEKKEDLIGKPYEVLKYFQVCDLKMKEIKKDINECDSWSGIIEYDDKDGIKHTFDTKIIPEINHITGSISNFLIIQNDISELVNKNKETEEMLERAKFEATMKSNFLATMSHEIRTPLNGMLPYIDLLLETKNLQPEQLDYIYTIKNSSESLLRIINDILDFSKIESGKLELEEISFDPIYEFETIIDLYLAKANEKNIKLLTFIDPNLPYLIGDPLRIKQIIHNFLSNAIKFTSEKGEIYFTVEKKINEINKNEIILNVSVKDNGKGIAKEHQSLIFNPFSQSDNSITRNFGGTGLGLSISKNLASLMNGNIILDSELGKGSSFSINIPLKIDDTISHRLINENYKKIAVFRVNKNDFIPETQLLCKYLEAMDYSYTMVYKENDLISYDIIFVISSGNDNIGIIDYQFLKEKRVITILNANVQNMNKFNCNFIIEMPINGSKIYDSINDVSNILQNDEKLLKKRNNHIPNTNVIKYNANILVAEDNLTNQKLVKTLLAKHELNVHIAENGLLALNEYITKGTGYYDLIFLDIHMPIMDGIQAICSIREFEKKHGFKNSNIVALTADAIKTHQQQYLEIGFDDFLAKPIEKNKFEATLFKYLKNKAKDNLFIENNDKISNIEKEENSLENLSNEKINNIMTNLDLDFDTSKMLLDDFMEQWITFKENLLKSLDDLDYKMMKSIAHSLKGAAGSLQLNDIYLLCKDLEELSKEENKINLDTYKNKINNLIKIID